MTYFANLRKREPELEPDEAVDEAAVEEEETEEQPAARGPLLTGLLGPGQWLATHFGMTTAWTVHAVAAWAIAFYGSWTAVGIGLGWLLAILLFVPRDFLEQLATRIEQRTALKAEEERPGEAGRDDVLPLLYALIGDAHGVHLRTVLAHLQEHGHWEGKTVADLRQHLEALGIPVQPKVKVDGTPTRGVLKADLDALPPIEETPPSPAPSPAV